MGQVVVDRDAVVKRLTQGGARLEEWGKGKAKTLDHLLNEIAERESILVGYGPELVREISALTIRVRCMCMGLKYELLEDRQVFKDGRVRSRKENDGSPLRGVREKLKPNEDLAAAVGRAIKEELSVQQMLSVTPAGSKTDRRESGSFPGLMSAYVFHFFTVELYPYDFRIEGYVEEQDDKTTYFRWEPLV